MSTVILTKSMSHSLSPAVINSRKTPKLSMNSSLNQDIEGLRPGFKLTQSVSQFPSNLTKLIKISAKKFQPKPSLLGFHIRESGKNNSVITSEAKASEFEEMIRKKLAKEEKLAKKLEVLVKFCEKLAGSSKTFKVFAGVFDEIVVAIQQELKEFGKLRKKQEDISELCDHLQNEVDALKDENDRLMSELERYRVEKRSLNNTIKKQSLLLNQLSGAGLPVEEFYQKTRNSEGKPKSHYKTQVPMKDEEKLNIPKLNIRDNPENEGYQEEFMSKFKEFSESWREQIIKNHHLTN